MCLYHLGLDSPRSLSRPSAIIKIFLFEKMKKAQPHPLPVGILLPLLDSVRFHRNQEHSSGPHDRKFPRETQEPECSCGSDVHFPITLYTVETRTSRAVQCWDTPHTKRKHVDGWLPCLNIVKNEVHCPGKILKV